MGIVTPIVFATADPLPAAGRPLGARLAEGAASLATLIVSPANANEDATSGHGAAAAASAAGAVGREEERELGHEVAHDFPPPPAMAPEASVRLAMSMPPRDPYIFDEPRTPVLGPAPGEEALARAAVRTAASLATPGWLAKPPAKSHPWARRVGEDLEAELRCLALNVYWEARSESALGRLAVAAVTLNRVANRNFPDTVCGVVHQGQENGLHRCQFSWVCDRRSDEPGHDAAWRDAEHVAFSALFLNLPDPTRGALWYHADYVSPPWAGTMSQPMQIGRHLFYRAPARTVEAHRGETG